MSHLSAIRVGSRTTSNPFLLRHAPVPTIRTLLYASSIILKNEQCAEGLRHLEVEVDENTASLYRQPGQYINVKSSTHRPVLLAIASPPDNRRIMSFLVKETASHEFLLHMKEGAKVDFSTPLGEGFQIIKGFHSPTPDLAVNHVLLMACGSGLAPIAAAIESGCLQLGLKNLNDELQAPSALLYIGARSPAHLPYAEKYVEWEEKGVKVVPVFSRTEGRYVQEALRADSLAMPKRTVALLCGMKGMTDSARELLLGAGVPSDRILLNY